jgi:hypothetical protein
MPPLSSTPSSMPEASSPAAESAESAWSARSESNISRNCEGAASAGFTCAKPVAENRAPGSAPAASRASRIASASRARPSAASTASTRHAEPT